MGNPTCPKCGKLMYKKNRLTGFSGHWGHADFWVCPDKSIKHGKVQFKVGSVIPRVVASA